MHIIYIFNNHSKIGVLHRGLPWVGGVSTKSATDGSRAPSYTRISFSYSSIISLYSCSPAVANSTNSLSAYMK